QLLGRAGRKRSGEEEKQAPKPAPQMTKPLPRVAKESDQERIRKFLEALGQPSASKPPPPVMPRTDIPPRPLAPVRPPVEPLIPHWKLTPEERRKRPYILKESPLPGGVTPAEQISAPAMTAVPAFQVHESPLRVEQQPIIKTQLEAYAASKTFGVAKTEDLKTDIATLLASKSGLRDAIILREIFGPPRGLQALEIGNIACSP